MCWHCDWRPCSRQGIDAAAVTIDQARIADVHEAVRRVNDSPTSRIVLAPNGSSWSSPALADTGNNNSTLLYFWDLANLQGSRRDPSVNPASKRCSSVRSSVCS